MGSHHGTPHRKGPRELVTGGEWVYGRNPVEEALAAGRRTAMEIILPPASPDEDDQLKVIRDEAARRRLVIRTAERAQLDKLTRFGNHQGVALKTTGYPYVGFEELLEEAESDENSLVIVLDHLEDPQNVGSILRTACADRRRHPRRPRLRHHPGGGPRFGRRRRAHKGRPRRQSSAGDGSAQRGRCLVHRA